MTKKQNFKSSAGEIDDSAEHPAGVDWHISNTDPATSPLVITIQTPGNYNLASIGPKENNGFLVIPVNAIPGGTSPNQVNLEIDGFTYNAINIVVYENYDLTARPKVDPKGTHIVHTGLGWNKRGKKNLSIRQNVHSDSRKPVEK